MVVKRSRHVQFRNKNQAVNLLIQVIVANILRRLHHVRMVEILHQGIEP